MNKKLFVISGCSGVGKGTVLKEFMAKNSKDFMLSVSCTTRKPREGEVDGINYFFLTQEEFKDCIAKDKFLEYAQFAGNFYGTKQKYINQKFEEGMKIAKQCNNILEETEKKITILLENDGELKEENFQTEE